VIERTAAALETLMRPSDFRRAHRSLFNTDSALWKHLGRRRENGLLESGAVVETALGLRIDPERFRTWFLNTPRRGLRSTSNADAAA
jgi:hypothetical protein